MPQLLPSGMIQIRSSGRCPTSQGLIWNSARMSHTHYRPFRKTIGEKHEQKPALGTVVQFGWGTGVFHLLGYQICQLLTLKLKLLQQLQALDFPFGSPHLCLDPLFAFKVNPCNPALVKSFFTRIWLGIRNYWWDFCRLPWFIIKRQRFRAWTWTLVETRHVITKLIAHFAHKRWLYQHMSLSTLTFLGNHVFLGITCELASSTQPPALHGSTQLWRRWDWCTASDAKTWLTWFKPMFFFLVSHYYWTMLNLCVDCSRGHPSRVALARLWCKNQSGAEAWSGRTCAGNPENRVRFFLRVCLKIGYIPNYSHLIGIMIINHWV